VVTVVSTKAAITAAVGVGTKAGVIAVALVAPLVGIAVALIPLQVAMIAEIVPAITRSALKTKTVEAPMSVIVVAVTSTTMMRLTKPIPTLTHAPSLQMAPPVV
jgi:hypothetical protein